MIQLSAELLALTAEPALLVRGGKILFANDAARDALGRDCDSKSFRELFGREIAGMQASSFVGETEAGGRRMLLRLRTLEGSLRAVFLYPCAPVSEFVGDAFLFALRSELMQLGVNATLLKAQLCPTDAAGADALRGISRSLYRANRTLQNLSVIRGAELQTLPFHPQPMELSGFLSDLVGSVRLCLSEPELCLTAPNCLPMLGVPELLETLVLNLLSNCVSHAAGCTCIRLTARRAGEQIVLSVNDDGCGIPPERLHTVLERFRYSDGMDAAEHGPGFGLTAVREIARLHGGTLLLESRVGAGTAVRVSFRLARPDTGRLKSAAAAYNRSFDSILTGLSTCLPPEAFDVSCDE